MKGRVIHRSIEKILEALRGRSPSADPETILGGLGGYSEIVETEIEEVLEKKVLPNPRIRDELAAKLESRLRNAAGELREKVQFHIASFDEIPSRTSEAFRGRDALGSGTEGRQPLSPGVYPEQMVKAPSIGWKGIIDLLNLGKDRCIISDIKTGAKKEGHTDQVRLYALLWWLDEEINPAGRMADTLLLRYPSETTEVTAPGGEELRSLRHDIEKRGERLRDLLDSSPPPARPEPARCSRCSVRHLCEAYWSTGKAESSADESLPGFMDADLRLLSSYSANLWHSQVLRSRHFRRGKDVIFKAEKSHPRLQNLDEIRVLDAQVSEKPAYERTMLRETLYSEVFLSQRVS